jgi:hypothetical protein
MPRPLSPKRSAPAASPAPPVEDDIAPPTRSHDVTPGSVAKEPGEPAGTHTTEVATPEARRETGAVDYEPMPLSKVRAMDEEDLEASVHLAVHLGRATRAVQLTVGAALTLRRDAMAQREWGDYLAERATQWGRNVRTLQRWMEAAQDHYALAPPKGAKPTARGTVQPPVIPRGGGRPQGSTAKASERPPVIGTLRGQKAPETAEGGPGDRPQFRGEISAPEALAVLIGCDDDEIGLDQWRLLQIRAEAARARLTATPVSQTARARDPQPGSPRQGASATASCPHPVGRRIDGVCGQCLRPVRS